MLLGGSFVHHVGVGVEDAGDDVNEGNGAGASVDDDNGEVGGGIG
jgi:hypothetical protein